MSINFNSTIFETMIDNFSKTLTRTPITKTESNLEGEETLTEGTPASISGAFYKKEDAYSQEKQALIQNADAVLLVKTSVTINKNDKITYSSVDYRVDEVETRLMGTTSFYKVARLFLV